MPLNNGVIVILPSGKNRQKTVWRSAFFLFIWHSKHSTILSKIHSFRLFFCRFCPLGNDV